MSTVAHPDGRLVQPRNTSGVGKTYKPLVISRGRDESRLFASSKKLPRNMFSGREGVSSQHGKGRSSRIRCPLRQIIFPLSSGNQVETTAATSHG